MTNARYRAELEALKYDTCDDSRCAGEHLVAEMYTCSWCDNTFCAVHFHAELGCCHAPTCVYQSANRLRELRDAALVVLEQQLSLVSNYGGFILEKTAVTQSRTALEVLKGEKR